MNLHPTPANQFNENDNLCCRLLTIGRELLELRLTGIKSLADIYRIVRSRLEGVRGIITLNVRNVTQGWTGHYSLCLN